MNECSSFLIFLDLICCFFWHFPLSPPTLWRSDALVLRFCSDALSSELSVRALTLWHSDALTLRFCCFCCCCNFWAGNRARNCANHSHKGLFTNYVSQKWGVQTPPAPFVSFVSISWTPPSFSVSVFKASPSGPMFSICRNVRLSVRPSVRPSVHFWGTV